MAELNNQPCYDKDGNFLGWFSRSVATTVSIFRKDGNKLEVLLEKRGKGCPDNVGKWCCVCGYLEFGLTAEENVIKEAKEEIGIDLKEDNMLFTGVSTKPTENHQNVCLYYMYAAVDGEDFDMAKAVGGEQDEVDEVKWFTIGEFVGTGLKLYDDVFESIDFAFNHNELIIDQLTANMDIL